MVIIGACTSLPCTIAWIQLGTHNALHFQVLYQNHKTHNTVGILICSFTFLIDLASQVLVSRHDSIVMLPF